MRRKRCEEEIRSVETRSKMAVKEIVSKLLEEEGLSHFWKERSWNDGLSKTLIKKKRDLGERKMVVKYESWVIK
nr:hypothetical protein [Tanacetum cinerariifolium]